MLRQKIGRPLNKKPVTFDLYQEGTESEWNILSQGIKEIFRHNESQLSFEMLYRNAYTMVIRKDAEKLYKSTRVLLIDHLKDRVQATIVMKLPTISLASSIDECEDFLKAFEALWNDHIFCLNVIKDVLMYLDRTYLPSRNWPSTYEMGLEVFRDNVIKSSEFNLSKHLITVLLLNIKRIRDKEQVDKTLTSQVVQILLSLPLSFPLVQQNPPTLYQSLLEQPFLDSTTTYYNKKAEAMLSAMKPTDYLQYVNTILVDEKDLVNQILSEKSHDKLINIVKDELLTKRLLDLINHVSNGLTYLLNEDRHSHLELMYTCFGLVEQGLPELKKAVGAYLKLRGSTLQCQNEAGKTDPILWVENLLKIHQKLESILKKSFNADSTFEVEINHAIQDTVNKNQKSPEYICAYADNILKLASKGKLDQEFDEKANNCISIFRYLNDKDMFERFYKQLLAKRLLNIKNINEHAEKSMLSKLKAECGYQFTSKLEGMFTDTRLSLEITNEFKTVLERDKPAFAFGVNVLTSTFWPFNSSDSPCQLPAYIVSTIEKFEKFYLSKHSGRRLAWQKQMGTADVRAIFPGGAKELNVSTYAMVVLTEMFNNQSNEPVSFSKIQEETEIPSPELKRVLQSLSLGKYRILQKQGKGKGKDIEPTDTFTVNLDFKAPTTKIKILNISSSANPEPDFAGDTREKVAHERKFHVEAAIVRIMKARKRLEHNNLISEVLRQLSSRFAPEPAMVKQRIESLIERDYLERDADARYY